MALSIQAVDYVLHRLVVYLVGSTLRTCIDRLTNHVNRVIAYDAFNFNHSSNTRRAENGLE